MIHFLQLYTTAQNRPKPSRLPFKTIYREEKKILIIERNLEPALAFLKLSYCFSSEAYKESIDALKAAPSDELNRRRSDSILYG